MKPSINAGIIASIISSIGFAAMDALTKQLVATLSPAHVLLYRSLVILMLFTPLAVWVYSKSIFKTEAKAETAWRSLAFALTSVLIVISLRHLTLAETISIFFICPMLTILLAAWWLDEKLTPRAGLACGLGFIGVVLIVQPFQRDGATAAWAFILPVLAACSGAVQDVLARKLKGRASPSTLLIYGVVATALGGALLAIGETPVIPAQHESWLLLASAVCGVVAFFFVVISFQFAPAAISAPLRFLNMVWAVLLGYFIWDSLPNLSAAMGILLVLASGLIAVDVGKAGRHAADSKPA